MPRLPTIEFLREMLHYEQDTGLFFWKVNARSRAYAGRQAGSTRKDGYVLLSCGGRPVFAHRAAFAIMTGEWPARDVDHINRVKGDNRWVNLRLVDRSHQMMNAPDRSGRRGTYRRQNGWVARVTWRGKSIHIGTFDTPEEAAQRAAHFRWALGQPLPPR